MPLKYTKKQTKNVRISSITRSKQQLVVKITQGSHVVVIGSPRVRSPPPGLLGEHVGSQALREADTENLQRGGNIMDIQQMHDKGAFPLSYR